MKERLAHSLADVRIPYGRQDVSEADIQTVVDVLRGDWLTQGPTIPAFEHAVAAKCGALHAVAVSSGTAALHIACLALGVGPGDTVWTSPITFVASANCARYCGAAVDFVDIDPDTWCLSSEALSRKLALARASNAPLPKVVIPVHLGGPSCKMEEIAALGEEYKFRIIEDASHSIGGSYQRASIGNCAFSDIAVFSFHPVKIVTTGEGGMALTNQAELADRMARLRTHGITRNASQLSGQSGGPWLYGQIDLGFNYRMTDIQAALGISQLKRLDEFVARRNSLAQRYNVAFANLPMKRQKIPEDVISARHLYIVRCESNRRLAIFEMLRASGIGVNVHYIPVHLQPYYRRLGFYPGQFPEAEEYYRETITLPLFAAMTDEEQERVIEAVRQSVL